MEGQHVNYLGRVVPVEGFRAFVYGADGTRKVVNSWTVFEEHIALGTWFATPEAAAANDLKPASKAFKAKGKMVTLEMPANDSVHIIEGTMELVRDDFLPNESA